jgi:hypothetical protein
LDSLNWRSDAASRLETAVGEGSYRRIQSGVSPGDAVSDLERSRRVAGVVRPLVQAYVTDILDDRWAAGRRRIGRNIIDRIVASLEVSVPIVKDYPVYSFKTEARVSFNF